MTKFAHDLGRDIETRNWEAWYITCWKPGGDEDEQVEFEVYFPEDTNWKESMYLGRDWAQENGLEYYNSDKYPNLDAIYCQTECFYE
jgi:hypothetical protein